MTTLRVKVGNLLKDSTYSERPADDVVTVVATLPEYHLSYESTFNSKKEHYFRIFTPKKDRGWHLYERSLYYISKGEKSWYDAEGYCMSKDAHLVSILNDEEQNFITSLLKHPTWIGLTYENEEDMWKWTDGSGLRAQYWPAGKPRVDGLSRGIKKVCVSIVPSDIGYNWNDEDCHATNGWVCKESLDNP
ncbi:CD209 antigen-like protein 2 isoform X2 [Hemicordylus capensis]|nr:CD209 antigen-like protein 2 isoform X2 [Hemicordylus capensis]